MENTNQLAPQAIPQPVSQNNQNVYYKPAGFFVRLLATIIDAIIIFIIAFPIGLILQGITGEGFSVERNSNFRLIAGIIFIIYEIAFLYFYGATIGKKLLNIKVVNLNYQKLGFGQVVLRQTIGQMLSGLVFNLGYLWVAIDDKKQAWHDKIAKTFVIHTKPITHDEYLKMLENKIGSLPYILIFTGLVEGIFVSIFAFSVVRQLTSLYENLGSNEYNPAMTYTMLGLIGLTCLAQIVWGVMLWLQRNTKNVSNNYIKIGKILLIVGVVAFVLLIPFLILSVIMPSYKLTSSF